MLPVVGDMRDSVMSSWLPMLCASLPDRPFLSHAACKTCHACNGMHSGVKLFLPMWALTGALLTDEGLFCTS